MITIRDRVVGFFLRSPDEELTRADIGVRWGVSVHTAHDAIHTMLRDGLLARKRIRYTWVYSPTPLLLALGDAT